MIGSAPVNTALNTAVNTAAQHNMAAANMILPAGEPLVFYTMSPPPAAVITASLPPPPQASVIPMMATAQHAAAMGAPVTLTTPFVSVSL